MLEAKPGFYIMTFGLFSGLKYLFFGSFRLQVCSLRRAILDCRLAVESSQRINISSQRTSQKTLLLFVDNFEQA